MDVEHQRVVAAEPPTDLHHGSARQFCHEAHYASPPALAKPCSLLDMLHPGLPPVREVGLTAPQLENLAIAKGPAKGYSGCLAIVSLDRNPAALWPTGFEVHGVTHALRTSSILAGYCSTRARQIVSLYHEACTPWNGACCRDSGQSNWLG